MKRTPLNVAQAAEVASDAGLPCSARTWHRWLKDLQAPELLAITHSTPGGRKFWYADEVEAFARSRCFTPAPPPEPGSDAWYVQQDVDLSAADNARGALAEEAAV